VCLLTLCLQDSPPPPTPRLPSQTPKATSRITWRRNLYSRSHITSHGDLSHQAAERVSSRVTSHGDLSHYMTAETVSRRVEAKITNNTWMNRLTLTYNKRRSPFHLPTAERLGATGGEPPQKGPRGTERVGDRRGAHSSHQAWKKRDRRTGHKQTAENCRMYRRCGTRSNVSEDRTQDAEHCRMYRRTQANGGKLSHLHISPSVHS